MSQESHLVEILCTLIDHHVDFVVAGGVAMVLHGVERMTLDLDVAVSLEPENLRRFLEAIASLGLVPRAPVPAEVILDQQSIADLIREKNALVFTFWSPEEPYRQIDLFLTRENSFDDLVADAYLLEIRARVIRVASRRKLIEMKSRVRPVREKDISDIRALTEFNPKNARMKEELEAGNSMYRFRVLESADFDGHTEFASMSPEQRLTWLSHVARFIFVAREATVLATSETSVNAGNGCRNKLGGARLLNFQTVFAGRYAYGLKISGTGPIDCRAVPSASESTSPRISRKPFGAIHREIRFTFPFRIEKTGTRWVRLGGFSTRGREKAKASRDLAHAVRPDRSLAPPKSHHVLRSLLTLLFYRRHVLLLRCSAPDARQRLRRRFAQTVLWILSFIQRL